MKPYKPSNIIPNEGVKNLTIVAIATGIITGGVVGFISQFFYLIILFPLVMGGAAGTAISMTVNKSKVRNPVVAALFGTLTALITYASMNYVQYMIFRQDVKKDIITNVGQKDDKEIDQLTNDVLKEETGETGFIGYIKYSAKQGMSINRAGRSGEGIRLDENATWIYWLIELAIIDGVAMYIAYGAAKEPFCEDGNDWYGDKAWNGCVELSRKDEFLQLVKSEDYTKAAELVSYDPDLELPRLDLLVQSCPSSPLSDLVLTVSKTSLNSKKNVESNELTTGLVTHRNRLDLLANQPDPNDSEEPAPEEQSLDA